MTATATLELGHRFADEVPDLVVEWQAAGVPAPALVALNAGLAVDLGLDADWLRSPEGIDVLAGNATPPGAKPVAMGYAGHQFGNPSPQLGDGRALLVGELADAEGRLHDLHLKGSGRTPFARGGDGKATLGPMLREFLVSEAMHALGIPTTRSLAVVTTGEQVARQRVEPGAILARIASSHVRVGTFQFARWVDDGASLRPLLAHTMARHCPSAVAADRPALALFEHVVAVQARLVADWMRVGFIHGVMNTDNTTISGETIDYGPCAFMDRFDPATVYSSIDHGGRYAYGNQPAIAQWNLARLAEAMLPLIDEDRDDAVALVTEALEGFVPAYQGAFAAGMAAKLGLDDGDGHSELFDELLALMHRARADFTSTFRQLADHLRGDDEALRDAFAGHADDLGRWLDRWDDALGDHDATATAGSMDEVNPVYIPRNHLVEAALDGAAVDGDLGPFDTLLDHVTRPYVRRPGSEVFERPAPDGFDEGFQTFCGT